jgi:uncharacterized membrane protein
MDLAVILAVLTGVGADAATMAMLGINRRAERGPFIVVFVGAALAAIALGVTALTGLPEPAAVLRLVAAPPTHPHASPA